MEYEIHFAIYIEYQLTNNIQEEVTFFTGIAENESENIQQSEIADFKWGKYDDIRCLLIFKNNKYGFIRS